MKKFNILAVAAVALTSVFGFTSCDQDDDYYFDEETNNSFLVSRSQAAIRPPKDPNDPFRGGVKYHFGDKVTKNIYKYGDAEFVCINDDAPYYFIHVSDKKYSMGEKDGISYAQSEYAATTETLKKAAELLQPHFFDWFGIHGAQDCNGYTIYSWRTENVKKCINTLRGFIPAKDYGEKKDVYASKFTIESEEFWIVNSHDYPYAEIKWTISGENIPRNKWLSDSPDNKVEVSDAHHWSYASPCDGHRIVYIAKAD